MLVYLLYTHIHIFVYRFYIYIYIYMYLSWSFCCLFCPDPFPLPLVQTRLQDTQRLHRKGTHRDDFSNDIYTHIYIYTSIHTYNNIHKYTHIHVYLYMHTTYVPCTLSLFLCWDRSSWMATTRPVGRCVTLLQITSHHIRRFRCNTTFGVSNTTSYSRFQTGIVTLSDTPHHNPKVQIQYHITPHKKTRIPQHITSHHIRGFTYTSDISGLQESRRRGERSRCCETSQL